jgi:indole-3-glycerol phosphate synthase
MSTDFIDEMVAAAWRRAQASLAAEPLQRPATPTAAGRLLTALRRPRAQGMALIAEVKRASPSRGPIAPGIDAAAQARAYERAGADAISVLTEPERFGGSLSDLYAVTTAVHVPVLRKDFLVHVQQIHEAAHAGAAGVLLIAAALDDAQLQLLLGECAACGLDALVEVHDMQELSRAAALGAPLIGVNNRDLATLNVDLATTERLAPLAPAGAGVVAESGIDGAPAALRMQAVGVAALLVGEALMRAPEADLPARIAALRGAVGEGGQP